MSYLIRSAAADLYISAVEDEGLVVCVTTDKARALRFRHLVSVNTACSALQRDFSALDWRAERVK